jgi:hypothetical protein
MTTDDLKGIINQAQRVVDDLNEQLDKQATPSYFEHTLDCNFAECERGNTLLVRCNEDGDDFNAWIRLEDDIRLEVTWRTGNYPSLSVKLCKVNDDDLFAHLLKEFDSSWTVRKLNLRGYDNVQLRELWKEKEDAE